MIIPKISAANFRSDAVGKDSTEHLELVEEIRYWSLFGTIALTDVDSFELEQLASILKHIGGSVDVEVELDSVQEADFLAILNAGAGIPVRTGITASNGPSQADRRITERLQSALALVDIRVLDHIIVARGDQFSFAEDGLL